MTPDRLADRLAAHRVVPVIAIDRAEDALPLADALIAGGLPVAEITFRTEAAPEALRRIAAERPRILLGAGTVTSPEQARAARDCGAVFAVAPGCNPAVIAAARDCGLAFAPGVMTPSDVEQALAARASLLKFFPAEAAGGLPLLKSLSGPYAHLGVRFIPTGGVNAANMGDYLALDTVAAVGGTWIAPRKTIAAQDWEAIAQSCREISE